MAVSKGLKRLIKKYVKVYGIRKGKKKAYLEWNRRKKIKHNKYNRFWWS